MNKKFRNPENLKPGDLWKIEKNKNLWMFLSGKKLEDKIFPGVFFWQLTWLGRTESSELGEIKGDWTQDSEFEIIS
jgi:hypothetical protein